MHAAVLALVALPWAATALPWAVSGQFRFASDDRDCREVSFNVTGTATNKDLRGVPLDEGVEKLMEAMHAAPDIRVGGPQTIAGTFCKPTTENANNDKIQILFSALTTNRGAWNALGGVGTAHEPYRPERYSWTQYANAQGYPTLAVDRLGVGKSSYPDPILVTQAPYDYDHIIWVGNSYGGQLGAGMAGAYPEAFDEFVLTGFTNTPAPGLIGFALTNCVPASQVDAARWGNFSDGYLTTESHIGRTNSYYGSSAQALFEPKMADLFFERKDVVGVGQFASVYGYKYTGGNFTGRVFSLIGEQDQPFCAFGSPVFGPASCGTIPHDTAVEFPLAQYNYKSVDQMGHIVQLHTRSRTIYDLAHRFLAGETFLGGKPA